MPWFEDIEIGSRLDLGSHTFTAEEIVAFAKKYDPQYFHTDPEAAKHGPFGTLTASGPSPGFLDMKWPAPVRAGDTISYSSEVIEKLDMRTRPGWGIVRSRNIGVNQDGETVLSFIGQGLIQRRQPRGA